MCGCYFEDTVQVSYVAWDHCWKSALVFHGEPEHSRESWGPGRKQWLFYVYLPPNLWPTSFFIRHSVFLCFVVGSISYHLWQKSVFILYLSLCGQSWLTTFESFSVSQHYPPTSLPCGPYVDDRIVIQFKSPPLNLSPFLLAWYPLN